MQSTSPSQPPNRPLPHRPLTKEGGAGGPTEPLRTALVGPPGPRMPQSTRTTSTEPFTEGSPEVPPTATGPRAHGLCRRAHVGPWPMLRHQGVPKPDPAGFVVSWNPNWNSGCEEEHKERALRAPRVQQPCVKHQGLGDLRFRRRGHGASAAHATPVARISSTASWERWHFVATG